MDNIVLITLKIQYSEYSLGYYIFFSTDADLKYKLKGMHIHFRIKHKINPGSTYIAIIVLPFPSLSNTLMTLKITFWIITGTSQLIFFSEDKQNTFVYVGHNLFDKLAQRICEVCSKPSILGKTPYIFEKGRSFPTNDILQM